MRAFATPAFHDGLPCAHAVVAVSTPTSTTRAVRSIVHPPIVTPNDRRYAMAAGIALQSAGGSTGSEGVPMRVLQNRRRTRPVVGVAFGPDGRTLVAGGSGGFDIWDL